MTITATSRPHRRLRHVWWIPQVALALAMLGAGSAKLGGEPAMIRMFDDIDTGHWFGYFVDALEVAGGIGP
ncbi:DoxX family protein [Micromonospora sp. NPDC005305]|uniref:DoxX family protein n=1 Tax=Micromonospora sp. NPDC005305 TaxID=3156875 RepID=UPI0033BC9F5F